MLNKVRVNTEIYSLQFYPVKILIDIYTFTHTDTRKEPRFYKDPNSRDILVWHTEIKQDSLVTRFTDFIFGSLQVNLTSCVLYVWFFRVPSIHFTNITRNGTVIEDENLIRNHVKRGVYL